MDAILRFLNQYEALFFILIGTVILVYARKIYLAWRDWSVALFGLEKEHSQRNINQGLTILIFSGLLGVGLFIINTFVTPSVPGVQQVATPTFDLTVQPKNNVITPLVQTTTEGLIPTLTAFLDKGCIPGQIEWTYPQEGGSITGKVELTGTVNVSNLGFYKVEYTPIDGDNWVSIVSGNDLITDAPFGGSWDTKNLTPGDYKFRLVVFNGKEEALPDCTIKVLIKASK
ncbi:MAG: hypothetical protein FD147_797 [Chloroflexi bacterium]|nr:MAG: hypothetical protein FD147_797 [Chloroflexota bacterium]